MAAPLDGVADGVAEVKQLPLSGVPLVGRHHIPLDGQTVGDDPG